MRESVGDRQAAPKREAGVRKDKGKRIKDKGLRRPALSVSKGSKFNVQSSRVSQKTAVIVIKPHKTCGGSKSKVQGSVNQISLFEPKVQG
jgi:hypothetical protein